MPRNQSRVSQRARAAQKTAGGTGKYSQLLRAKPGPRGARREPARRLAAQLRADLGAEGEKAARMVDAAVAWGVKDRELKHAPLRTQGDLAVRAPSACRGRARRRRVIVHDAPLAQVVHMVLEAAVEEEESADLLRAAAEVLSWLVGTSHIRNPAICRVRVGEWLTELRMWERVYTTTDPVAVVAAAALRMMREAARIPDEDELTDANCMLTLQEAVRFARTAADLAARLTHPPRVAAPRRAGTGAAPDHQRHRATVRRSCPSGRPRSQAVRCTRGRASARRVRRVRPLGPGRWPWAVPRNVRRKRGTAQCAFEQVGSRIGRPVLTCGQLVGGCRPVPASAFVHRVRGLTDGAGTGASA
ncbi:hypothetical protein [Streptomyces sp. NBC_00568]|uniref:hypothetical protein n=1 Tax=Streptomyces sp. NBC_00568 TaxID=2975779 RepID=UPI0022598C45|nr:hypothetical protein [Streptomyces sp. NBC_00568]MCX4993711.1 hypothetical protein [Streptomyces sp. NBC_00568]